MARLLLVRHATSVRPTPGGPDEYTRPLTPEGLAQADALVDELSAERPTRFLSSPYLRAVQTVQPAAAALGLQVEHRDELREWRSGLPPRADWQPAYRDGWERPEIAAEGGESHLDLQARAVAAVRAAAAAPDDDVSVLASHGTWISRALHGLGLPVDADFWFAMPMPAIYRLALTDDAVTATGPGLSGC